MNKITATITQSFDPAHAEFLNDVPFELDVNECRFIEDDLVHVYYFRDEKWVEEDEDFNVTEVTNQDIIKTLDEVLTLYIRECLVEDLLDVCAEINKHTGAGISNYIQFHIKN